MLRDESTRESPIEALYRQFMPHYTRKLHNLSVAIELAKAGYPVFPCRENGPKGVIKSPYTKNGFKAATTSLDQIEEWWNRWPDAVVGLPTGERPGLAVVDLDIRDDGRDGESALEAAGIDARSAVRVRTPSGGLHIYFRHTDGIGSAGGILSGVDVRGEGGYVIAPGSRMADGTIYRYVGRDRLDDDALRLPRFPAAIRDMMSRPHNDGESDVEALGLTIDEARGYLDELAGDPYWRDRRDGWLRIGQALHHEFGGDEEAFELWREFSEDSEFYSLRELKKDWRSFREDRPNPVTFASIVEAARGGWAMTLAEAKAAFAEDEDDEPIEPDAPLFRSAARWAGKSAPPREWHIKDMIPAEAVTLLYGDGGTGKSLVGLQLAMATAVGGNWIGQKIRKPGRALFMSAEDSEDELWRRLEDIADSDCREMADLEDLYVESFVDRDPLLSTVDVRARRVRPTELYRRLEREIARLKPTLVVLDTLANLHAGNENDKTEAMQFVNLLKRLASRHGCSIVMLAHPSMNGMSSGSGTAGSVAWSNGVRSRLYLTRIKNEAGGEDDEDARVLRVMKANYSAGGDGIPLRWRDGVFAVDDGEETEQREERVERRFLTLLDEMTRQGRHVSSVMCSTYAPSLFAKHPDSGGFSTHEFAGAMERLLTGERIQLALHGKGASKRQHIERSDS